MNKRYLDFLKFAKRHNYELTEVEKQIALDHFENKTVSFPNVYGKKLQFNLILEYYRENNIYSSVYEPKNV